MCWGTMSCHWSPDVVYVHQCYFTGHHAILLITKYCWLTSVSHGTPCHTIYIECSIRSFLPYTPSYFFIMAFLAVAVQLQSHQGFRLSFETQPNPNVSLNHIAIIKYYVQYWVLFKCVKYIDKLLVVKILALNQQPSLLFIFILLLW